MNYFSYFSVLFLRGIRCEITLLHFLYTTGHVFPLFLGYTLLSFRPYFPGKIESLCT